MCPILSGTTIKDRLLRNSIKLSSLKSQRSDSVVNVSGHLRPPGQHVSVTEPTVSRETVSGSGPEGRTAQTSGGASGFFVLCVCEGEPMSLCGSAVSGLHLRPGERSSAQPGREKYRNC